MLTCLQIRDFAIIDQLQVELGPGLNVVTGETGAGKSILIGALELVLGGKGRPEYVRAGAKQAEVEALFEVAHDHALRQKLEALQVSDQELVVRRVVLPNGRTRAFINGRLATREQLAELTRGLTDISSQHMHHTLTDPATHLGYLDAFGGLAADRTLVLQAYQALQRARDLLQRFEARLRERTQREAAASATVREIETVQPRVGEDVELEAEAGRLRHAETLLQLLGEAVELLCERDESALDGLAQAGQRLAEAAGLDPALTGLAEQLESARAGLEDTARDLSRRLHSMRPDPEALEQARATPVRAV
jgi:DNA repair protein RecN (Recombination protein N)